MSLDLQYLCHIYRLINAKTFDIRTLINAETLAPKGCKLASQIQWYPFLQPLRPIQGHKIQHLLVT